MREFPKFLQRMHANTYLDTGKLSYSTHTHTHTHTHTQSGPFILSHSMTASSHRKSASAATTRDSCLAQRPDKRDILYFKT